MRFLKDYVLNKNHAGNVAPLYLVLERKEASTQFVGLDNHELRKTNGGVILNDSHQNDK